MDVLGKAEQDLLAGKITWAEFEELINPSVKVPLTAAERKRKQRAKTVRPGKRGKDKKPRKAKELTLDATWDSFLAKLPDMASEEAIAAYDKLAKKENRKVRIDPVYRKSQGIKQSHGVPCAKDRSTFAQRGLLHHAAVNRVLTSADLRNLASDKPSDGLAPIDNDTMNRMRDDTFSSLLSEAYFSLTEERDAVAWSIDTNGYAGLYFRDTR